MEDPTSAASASDKGCPYGHARDEPMLAPTVPVFAPITLRPTQPHDTAKIEDDPVAMLIQQANFSPAITVTAIADSGASHILLRRSDAHILRQVEYTQPPAPPPRDP